MTAAMRLASAPPQAAIPPLADLLAELDIARAIAARQSRKAA